MKTYRVEVGPIVMFESKSYEETVHAFNTLYRGYLAGQFIREPEMFEITETKKRL